MPLGAVILFDLLMNQRLPGEPAPADDLEEVGLYERVGSKTFIQTDIQIC